MIDNDGSKTIDKQETLKFWSSNFAKLNTNELFDQVDKNNDGAIQLEEWIEFWTTVYLSGYSEDELVFELDNLINHGSWVKFETPEKKGIKKSSSLKANGKK
jgi:Ca2+-binding EF-hand superfamily protein